MFKWVKREPLECIYKEDRGEQDTTGVVVESTGGPERSKESRIIHLRISQVIMVSCNLVRDVW